MIDRVQNMPLDYLSCFAMVLQGIYENVWYMPNCIVFTLNLKFFHLFRSHTRKYNIHAFIHDRLAKVEEKWSTTKFDVFDLPFIFFIPMFQTKSAINRSSTCYFLHISNWWYKCYHVHMQLHAPNGEVRSK